MHTLSHQNPEHVNKPVAFQAMPAQVWTRQSIRLLEQQHPGLMPKAANALVQAVKALMAASVDVQGQSLKLLCAVGPGNNGGDVLMAIPMMLDEGWQVTLCLVGASQANASERIKAWAALQSCCPHPQLHIQPDAVIPVADNVDVLIDGLYGLGYQPARMLDDNLDAAKQSQKIHQTIGHMNAYRLANPKACVLAVDIPSGLCADSGWVRDDLVAEESVVVADVTLALLANKPGYYQSAGPSVCGELWFDNLEVNLPNANTSEGIALNAANLWQAQLPKRPSHYHKGMGGEVVVVGGAAPMWGAGLLAGEAALALGAGRVYAWNNPASAEPPPWLGVRPEIIHGLPREGLAHKVLLLGPGLGLNAHATQTLTTVFANTLQGGSARARVWDADALIWLQHHPTYTHLERDVMTPHPLEAARLLGLQSAKAVQQDRVAAAKALALRYQCVVVLKGCGTLIAVPYALKDGEIKVHMTINPGAVPALGTAGTGDVLAGAIAALLAQGLPTHVASLIAVWLHNQAGMKLMHQQGLLMARELIPMMRQLLHEITLGNVY